MILLPLPRHYARDIPAGTWRKYNVASTSVQCHDVALTLRRRYIYDVAPTLRQRYIYVMCLPGSRVGHKEGIMRYQQVVVKMPSEGT